MNTSPPYIRAAQDGITEARKRDKTAVFSFGMEAVRNCGYQFHRDTPSQKINGRGPTDIACYIVASVPNQKLQHLLTFINVKLSREARVYSLLSSTIFKERMACFGEDIKPLLMRKIAAICADVLISYAHRINASRMAQMKGILEVYSKKLIEVKQVVEAANEDLKNKNLIIGALLECRVQDEASRAHDERSCAYTETLIGALKDQLGGEEKLSDDLQNPACKGDIPFLLNDE